MEVIYWIIFGLIAGGIANYISPGFRGGFLGSTVLGILGAIVGGYLGQMFFGVGVTGFNFSSFIVAVIGSLIVLFIASLFNGRKVV